MKNLHDIPREKAVSPLTQAWNSYTSGNHAVNVLHGRNGAIYINDPLQNGIRIAATTEWTLTTTNNIHYDEI